MAENVVYVRATRDAIIQAIARVPLAARSGGAIADAMMVRCGMAALGHIKKAFIAKARGGTDEAGESWKPLEKSTVAYSRRHRKKPGNPAESRVFSRAKNMPWIPQSHKRASYAPSYALTSKQNKRWWEVYRRNLVRFKGDKGHAAAVAWIILKQEGATTLMEQYGNEQVDILRDTGLLLNSISPGTSSSEQVFRVEPGSVIIGTNRKWAAVHHYGSKDGRIPQRRLWPEPKKWPANWWADITEQVKQGIMDLIVYLLKRGNG